MTYLQLEVAKLIRNDKQREAYLCDDHCVVQAGPGSGKTATLTLKIMRLLTEMIPPPRGLACLTFNNEAVREFRNRLKRLGLSHRTNVFLGTLHSFCLSCVIRPFSKLFIPGMPSTLKVASDDIRKAHLQKALDNVGITDPPWEFIPRFDRYRRTFLDRNSKQWLQDEEYARAIEYYESQLHAEGYLDFDDLILIALRLIETEPFVRRCLSARFPWFVIDEYQDLGYPLHRIILSLLDNTNIKLFAVGDPDQSIYGFAGANPKYIQQLATRSGITPITLDLNYRCGQRIIDGAQVILDPSVPRNYRSSRGDSEPGEVYFIERSGGLKEQVVTIVDEILPQLSQLGYEPRNTAILYLDRRDASTIIDILNDKRIKYAGEKDQRYPRTPTTRWIEDLAQWCCGIRGEDGVRFRDLTNFWIRLLNNVGKTITDEQLLPNLHFFYSAISDLQEPDMLLIQWLSELDKRLSLQETLSMSTEMPEEKQAIDSMLSACGDGKPLEGVCVNDFAGCGPNTNRMSLNTLHSSKGLQFDVVIIPGLEEGRLPSWGAQSIEAVSEARRTFYVGFTRARYLVYLLYSGWYQNQYGRVFDTGPSRFVLELQEALSS